MEILKGFTLNVQGIPAGQSAVRYDSRERGAPLMEAMKTLKGMALFKVEGLSFVLDLEKNDQEWVHIHGVNHASLSDVCSRCAERFAFAVAREIDLTFIPQGELPALDPKDEGDVVATYQGHSIDLFPFLMEPVFLEMPINPVCREGCRGLCPNCGVNLNLSSCSCSHEGADLSLRDLIVQTKQRNEPTT